MSCDKSLDIQHAVQRAFDDQTPLCIRGTGSKHFYGQSVHAEHTPLETSGHTGVTSYEPTELVITARNGTTLTEIESVLNDNKQMLPFEPPHFGDGGSIGGIVASGLSGPRRPYSGSLRDAVLGVRCINGKGEILRFGGEVIKNVAGYDVSRLMAGSMGTLGVLLDISIRVIPTPEQELTLVLEQDTEQALQTMIKINGKALSISGCCHHDNTLSIRLSGNQAAVQHARKEIGGDELDQSNQFWQQLRDHHLAFFNDPRPLWRLSLPPATRSLDLDGDCIIDWAGAQRWLKTDKPADKIRSHCHAHGGHATLYNPGSSGIDAFQPLPPAIANLHVRLKESFDPHGILNPGRMYSQV